MEAERDSLQDRLVAARQREEQQKTELENTVIEWQEQSYSAQEAVRTLTAELQSLQVRTSMP